MSNTNEKNYLTLNGMSGMHLALILLSVAMAGTAIYLTKHYYEVHFSTSIATGSFCDLSSFWTCDTATQSTMSSIFNIPTSVYGLVFALFLIAGSIFPSKAIEDTNAALSKINLLGCIALFIYSLASLGTLCPMCSVYYVLSIIIAILFYKSGHKGLSLSPKVSIIYLLVFSVIGGSFAYNIVSKRDEAIKNAASIKNSLITQFNNIEAKGDPILKTPFHVLKSTEDFSEAPIRVSVFSDFQCPFCAKLTGVLKEFKQKYQGKMNISYYFYPLDMNCNKGMKRAMHPLACRAAYIASCSDPAKFNEVHDEIFEHQQGLSAEWLDEYSKKLGTTQCEKDPKTKENIVKMIEEANRFGVQSTPTLIINGKRIDGLIATNQFFMIFDYILEQSGN